VIAISAANNDLGPEQKNMKSIVQKSLLKGQLITYTLLESYCNVSDPRNHPDLPENKELIGKIEALTKNL
jgi:hypothetical protein